MKLHLALPGLATYLDRAHAFKEADPHCSIWTLQPSGGQVPETLRDHVRGAAGRWRVPRSLGQWLLCWRLRDVDQAHACVLYSYFGLFDALHARTRRRPHVLNIHASVSPAATWFDDATTPPDVRDRGLAALRRANLRMELVAARNADRIVVQAPGHVAALARATKRPASDFDVIPNAVVASRFVEGGSAVDPWLALAESRPTLLFVGNLRRFKGVLDLIQAFATICSADSRAVLLLLGRADSPETEVEVDALIVDLGLPSRVHRIGNLPQPQTFALMRAARAVVLPSYFEGMPRVLLESLDLGTPVVAACIPGISAIDPAGAAMLFHRPGDRAVLAEQLGRVLDHTAAERRRLIDAGHEIIELNHRPHVVGRRIRELCEQASSRKRGA